MTLARHGHRFQPDIRSGGQGSWPAGSAWYEPPPGRPPRARREMTTQPRMGRCAAEKEKKALALDSGLKPFVFWASQSRVTKHGLSTTRARGYVIFGG